MGKADKLGLIWQGMTGTKRNTPTTTFVWPATRSAPFCADWGSMPGDRVCLFMDKIPELYLGFVGVLKIGAVAQPLFSAFGEESLFVRLSNAETCAIITQRKHVGKVRKIIHELPHLKHIIVVDYDGKKPLQDREVAFSLEDAPKVEHIDIHPTKAESPSVLHYTSGTTGLPKGVQHVHYSLMSQYLTTKWVLDINDDDIYWCTADPGWVTGTSYGIIGAVCDRRHPVCDRHRFFGRSLVPLYREIQDYHLVLRADRHSLADEGG